MVTTTSAAMDVTSGNDGASPTRTAGRSPDDIGPRILTNEDIVHATIERAQADVGRGRIDVIRLTP